MRLASLERYLEANGPMPLVIDDIPVNFDDDRSEACLRVLAEISKKTQVIYFTPHKYIPNLARKAMSDDVLKVHHLH